jgi:hypothetical protein
MDIYSPDSISSFIQDGNLMTITLDENNILNFKANFINYRSVEVESKMTSSNIDIHGYFKVARGNIVFGGAINEYFNNIIAPDSQIKVNMIL